MKSTIIFPLFRSARLLLITGALAFALHGQAPLVRANACDDVIPADQWDNTKTPRSLKKPKCEGCYKYWGKMNDALRECYAGLLNDAKNRSEKAGKDKGDKEKDKPKEKDKQKAGADKAKGGNPKEQADKDIKDACGALGLKPNDPGNWPPVPKGPDGKGVEKEKSLKELQDAVKAEWEKYKKRTAHCENNPSGGHVDAQDEPKQRKHGELPTLPDCWKNEDEKKKFDSELETAQTEIQDDLDGFTKTHPGQEAALKAKLQEAKDLKEKAKKIDYCPKGEGGNVPVPPGGGGKDQKSMLPPGPGQEQKTMAPGQPPPADETSGGSKLETATSPGVVTKTISVMDDGEIIGEVVANLPDDSTGTFTGTVEAKPAGKTDEERARNQTKLNQVVIQVGDQQVKPENKTFTCTEIPPETANQLLIVVVKYKDKQIAKTSVPPQKTTSSQTTNNQLPWFGQTGRNLVIPHSCDGKVSPTDSVKVGGQTLPLIVETQRMRVVRDVSNATGPTQLEFSEQGQVTRAPFQNMSVQLAADKSRLKPNEKAMLKMTVSGMRGITKPVGVEMVNNSAGIVSLRGGNVQRLVLDPSDVGPDGSCLKTFTLTGKTPGAYNIRATLEAPRRSETGR